MKRRKKQGSSMIIVIACFAILSILGTSMLAVTSASYKLRIEEGNRMKNLYAAESGLDQAFVKLSEVVQDALNKGSVAVSEAIKNANGSNIGNVEIGNINEIYRANYMKHIKENLLTEINVNFNTEYSSDPTNPKAVVECKMETIPTRPDETLHLDGKNGQTVTFGDRVVTLESTYKSPSTQKERIVSVAYTVVIPEYYRIETSKGEEISNIIKYSLASDGNLNINDSESLSVNGDVWVKGNNSTSESLVDLINKKYEGGIYINNSKVIFSGDVNSANNINLNGAEANLISSKTDDDGRTIDTSVYAENISLSAVGETRDSKVNGIQSSLYLANDLVIDSNNAQVDVKSYYGFNDITTENIEGNYFNRDTAVRGSSSIIINSEKWPDASGSIDVSEKAYIMGSAYINTKEPYQTGESIALKGNYKVYSTQAEGTLDKYIYEYVNPLMLVTRNSQGKPLSIEEKAEYFATNSKDVEIRKSGIKLPFETYSVGAYISKDEAGNDKVFNSTTTLESQAMDAMKYKTDYVKSVYYMNDKNYNSDNVNYDIAKDFLDGSAKKNVENQINWDGVDKLIAIRNENVFKLDGITLILNNSSKELNIKENSIFIGDILIESNVIHNMENGIKYIIVSTTDVNFESESNFNGSIFSKGNINVNNVTKTNGTQVTVGMTPLTEKELNSQYNAGVLDLIFTIGERSEGNVIIQAENLISKEKWKLIK